MALCQKQQQWIAALLTVITCALGKAQDVAPVQHDLATILRDQMSLQSWDLQSLDVPPVDGDQLRFEMTIQGRTVWLALFRRSMTAKGAMIYEVNAAGDTMAASPMFEDVAFWGDVMDLDEGKVGEVACLIEDGQAAGVLRFTGDSVKWHFQPLNTVIEDANPRTHVVHCDLDVLPIEGMECGVEDSSSWLRPSFADSKAAHPHPRGAGEESATVMFDFDFPFFEMEQSAVSPKKRLVRRTQRALNEVNFTFDSVGIHHEFGDVVLRRTSAQDPYTQLDAGLLLDQMAAHWRANFDSLRPRAFAHLMTGRNLILPTITSAYVGGVCGNEINGQPGEDGYGLTRVISSNDNTQGLVLAHGMGHTWSAVHCNGAPDCGVMFNPIAFGVSTEEFGMDSQNAILSVRDGPANTCTQTQGPAPSFPVFTDFEVADMAALLSEGEFTYQKGGQISTTATNEVSRFQSLRFDSLGASIFDEDVLRSAPLDTRAAACVVISFWYEQVGGSVGEELLRVQGLKGGWNWNQLLSIHSDGVPDTGFTFVSVDAVAVAGAQYQHDHFRLQMKGKGDSIADSIFIDDLQITTACLMTFAGGEEDDHALIQRSAQTNSDSTGRRPVTVTLVGAPKSRPFVIYGSFQQPVKQRFVAQKGLALDLRQPFVLAEGRTDPEGNAVIVTNDLADTPSVEFWGQALVIDGEEGRESVNSVPMKYDLN